MTLSFVYAATFNIHLMAVVTPHPHHQGCIKPKP